MSHPMIHLYMCCQRCERFFDSGFVPGPTTKTLIAGAVVVCPYCIAGDALPAPEFGKILRHVAEELSQALDPAELARHAVKELGKFKDSTKSLHNAVHSGKLSFLGPHVPTNKREAGICIGVFSAFLSWLMSNRDRKPSDAPLPFIATIYNEQHHHGARVKNAL